MTSRLLAGPALGGGPESLRDHVARLGPMPLHHPADVLAELDASGLLGRGGAGFPVGRKWRTVAERGAAGGSDGAPVVLANGAEGEPLSAKDQAVMTLRPQLVLDGALLAAHVTGASEVVLYVGAEHASARRSMARAVADRAPGLALPMRLVDAPPAYVSGEESAAVRYVNESDARPTMTPPRVFERGIDGRPTLVQNVETLAHAALIARHGAAWYREPGTGRTRGTGLVTVSGVPRRGVREIALGTTVAEVADAAGLASGAAQAVLMGGYFGGWVDAGEAAGLTLDPTDLRAVGRAFGCGVLSFLPVEACGVRATARIMDYMAGQSAAQCGPCVFGLRAVADATARLAEGSAGDGDLARLQRWSAQLVGRGACRHPDGAVGLLTSAMVVFGDEFALHQAGRRCSRPGAVEAAA